MFAAVDDNNILVDVDEILVDDVSIFERVDKKYFCPICKNEVIIKKGSVRVPHFAHKSLTDCDIFGNDMTEWHRAWQKRFKLKYREIVLEWKEEISPFNLFKKGDKHRADILYKDYVIEFQNSPISSDEFDMRNIFYKGLGYKVVWIFNLIEADNIEYYDDWSNNYDNGAKYKWKWASKTFQYYDSRDKNIILMFQFKEINDDQDEREQCYFERVTWAIDSNNDENITDFKRFCTSYYPGNILEVIDQIRSNTL